VDEKGWDTWKERLPESHIWACDFAIKNRNKGRAKGGFIIGKKKEGRADKCKLIAKKKEGVIGTVLELDKELLNVVSVYGEQGGKNLIGNLEEIIETEREGNVIIGGDFNLRLGNLGKKGIGEGETERHSKDKCIGNGGTKFIDWINEKGWEILNGCTEGDWEGEFTYIGARRCSVIDYVIVNERIGNRISRFRVGDRVDSDHMPLEVTLEVRRGRGQDKKTQEQEKKKSKVIEKIICVCVCVEQRN